jgi:diguanylate cyclase (GGDEF)-like protein
MFALEYTPYIWPFLASLIVTTGLGIYAYRRRHLPVARLFAALMLALTIWTFCYAMELVSATLAGKVFWASAKYFGATSGPVIWFILALRFTKNDHWLTPALRLALTAFAVVTCLVVFTNDVHHWYWTRIYILPGMPETQTDHGFYFWVYAGVTYSLVLTSVTLFFQYYRTTPAFYRRQALLMALGGFVPLAGRILEDFLKIDLFPKVDNIVLLFLISGILFAYAIFRYSALHVVHIAHNLVIHNLNAGIVVLDVFERIVELNPYAKALARPASTSPIGRPLHEVFDSWLGPDIRAAGEHEVAIPNPAGEQWLQVHSAPIRAENGALAGYALTLFDITARKQAEQQLADLARTDPLTEIANRRHFYELATAQYARAERYGRALVIMMLDIDHFKQINDTYGHLVGDEVIKQVAAECRRQLRTTDLFARYGGEEFICLLEEEHTDDAVRTAERLRQIIAAYQLHADQRAIQVTISVGLAALRRGGSGLAELIEQADQALYISKSGGRNRVSVWGGDAGSSPLAREHNLGVSVE